MSKLSDYKLDGFGKHSSHEFYRLAGDNIDDEFEAVMIFNRNLEGFEIMWCVPCHKHFEMTKKSYLLLKAAS